MVYKEQQIQQVAELTINSLINTEVEMVITEDKTIIACKIWTNIILELEMDQLVQEALQTRWFNLLVIIEELPKQWAWVEVLWLTKVT
jgi:hypothetical protein